MNRAGRYVQNLTGELAYSSFQPTILPPQPTIEKNETITRLLVDANKSLAFLNGITRNIPNVDLFVSMYIRKEALLSSQIEGTQCTIDDVLDPLIENNVNRDISDVLNYVKANDYAYKRLETLPLCNRLIKEMHAILLEDTRGSDKNSGEFRNSQNWIGGQGCTLKNARYIPPNVEDMLEGMSQLERYMNSDDELDPLIQAALVHYQFETLHPFLDGNGRIGRLLIALFLKEKNIINTPVLYPSYYLKLNRVEYYDRMTYVRETGDYEQWVAFFLKSLLMAANDAIETIFKITKLHDESFQRIQEVASSRQKTNILKVFAYIEKNPIIDIQKTSQCLNLSYNTINSAVTVLVKCQILVERHKIGKTKIYSYEDYLDILRKDV